MRPTETQPAAEALHWDGTDRRAPQAPQPTPVWNGVERRAEDLALRQAYEGTRADLEARNKALDEIERVSGYSVVIGESENGPTVEVRAPARPAWDGVDRRAGVEIQGTVEEIADPELVRLRAIETSAKAYVKDVQAGSSYKASYSAMRAALSAS